MVLDIQVEFYLNFLFQTESKQIETYSNLIETDLVLQIPSQFNAHYPDYFNQTKAEKVKITNYEEFSLNVESILYDKNTACVGPMMAYNYLKYSAGRDNRIDEIRPLDEPIFNFMPIFISQKGHPVINRVNIAILQMHAYGITLKIYQDSIKFPPKRNVHHFNRNKRLSDFEFFQICFVFYGFGLLISVVAFVGEYFYYYYLYFGI